MGRNSCWIVLPVTALLAGCRGELVAKAELTHPGLADVSFVSTGAKLLVWADCDADWVGRRSADPVFDYTVEVLQEERSLGVVTCSTAARATTSVCGGHSNVMGSHSGDCEYQLACQLPPLPKGPLKFRVTGQQGENVKAVRNMSLNFRTE